MNKQKELAKNTLILSIGKLSPQVISFLLLPLYTEFLSPSDYGTVDLILTYVTLLAPVITLQLEMAVFRFLIDARNDETQKAHVISSTLQIATITLLIFTSLYFILDRYVHAPYLYLVFLSIFAAILSNLFLQIARGLGSNKKYASASIVASFATIAFNILFIVILHMGARGMLLAMVLGSVISAVYLFISLRLYSYITLKKNDQKLKRKLLKYSLPLVPNGLSWWVINAADRSIISFFLGLSANGIYAIAYKFPIIFASFFSVFSMSWTESASLHIDAKDNEKFFSQTFNTSVKLFGALGLIILAGIPIVFHLLIKSEFNEAYLYIPILIIAAFFNSLVGLYSAIYIAKKMTKQVANTSIFSAVISIGLNLILIHFIGLYAAALSTAVAYLAMAIFRHFDIKKFLTITYEKGIFLALIAAYAVVIALYYLNNPIGNVANILITIAIVVVLNKKIFKTVQKKVRP